MLSPELESVDLERFMREALQEADQAGQAGELPIGAVVVIDDQVIARGRARHQETASQIRHAELNALLAGGRSLWENYARAILFTTAEPCPLCLGAAVMADVPHIVFAAHDHVVHSAATVRDNPYVARHIRSYHGGVLETESRALSGQYNPRMLDYITNARSKGPTRGLAPADGEDR